MFTFALVHAVAFVSGLLVTVGLSVFYVSTGEPNLWLAALLLALPAFFILGLHFMLVAEVDDGAYKSDKSLLWLSFKNGMLAYVVMTSNHGWMGDAREVQNFVLGMCVLLIAYSAALAFGQALGWREARQSVYASVAR